MNIIETIKKSGISSKEKRRCNDNLKLVAGSMDLDVFDPHEYSVNQLLVSGLIGLGDRAGDAINHIAEKRQRNTDDVLRDVLLHIHDQLFEYGYLLDLMCELYDGINPIHIIGILSSVYSMD